MSPSEHATRLILRSEPVRPPHRTFTNSVGQLACGYNHVLAPGGENVQLPLSRDNAYKLLVKDLEAAGQWVMSKVKGLDQCELDAVSCWAFQARSGQCSALNQTPDDSLLMAHLSAGRRQLALSEFGNWVYAGKRFSQRLVQRRLAEQQLFQGSL